MKNFRSLALFVALLAMMISCAKDIDPDGNLDGTWQVEKVEGQQYTNGNPGIYLTDNNPTGTIQFKKTGWGEQDYSFTLFGTAYPQNNSFKWSATESEIIIDVVNGDDMIWARELNQSDKQIASYDIVVNANTTIKYTLTLEK